LETGTSCHSVDRLNPHLEADGRSKPETAGGKREPADTGLNRADYFQELIR
jgi:hypothetical protein